MSSLKNSTQVMSNSVVYDPNIRWSQLEVSKLNEMREILKPEIESRSYLPDVLGDRRLLRFLRGHKYNMEKACDMFRKFLLFREEHKVDHIRHEILYNPLMKSVFNFPYANKILPLFPQEVIAWDVYDAHGNPMSFEQYNFNPETLIKNVAKEEFRLFFIYTLEYRMLVLEQLAHEREKAILSSITSSSSSTTTTTQITLNSHDDEYLNPPAHRNSLIIDYLLHSTVSSRSLHHNNNNHNTTTNDNNATTDSPRKPTSVLSSTLTATAHNNTNYGTHNSTIITPYGLILSVTTVRDASGVGLSFMGTAGREFLEWIVTIAADNYPETLHRTYLIQLPWIFPTVWSFVSTLLDPSTVAKVSLHGHSYFKELTNKEGLKIESLPVWAGGTHLAMNQPFAFDVTESGPFYSSGSSVSGMSSGSSKISNISPTTSLTIATATPSSSAPAVHTNVSSVVPLADGDCCTQPLITKENREKKQSLLTTTALNIQKANDEITSTITPAAVNALMTTSNTIATDTMNDSKQQQLQQQDTRNHVSTSAPASLSHNDDALPIIIESSITSSKYKGVEKNDEEDGIIWVTLRLKPTTVNVTQSLDTTLIDNNNNNNNNYNNAQSSSSSPELVRYIRQSNQSTTAAVTKSSSLLVNQQYVSKFPSRNTSCSSHDIVIMNNTSSLTKHIVNPSHFNTTGNSVINTSTSATNNANTATISTSSATSSAIKINNDDRIKVDLNSNDGENKIIPDKDLTSSSAAATSSSSSSVSPLTSGITAITSLISAPIDNNTANLPPTAVKYKFTDIRAPPSRKITYTAEEDEDGEEHHESKSKANKIESNNYTINKVKMVETVVSKHESNNIQSTDDNNNKSKVNVSINNNNNNECKESSCHQYSQNDIKKNIIIFHNDNSIPFEHIETSSIITKRSTTTTTTTTTDINAKVQATTIVVSPTSPSISNNSNNISPTPMMKLSCRDRIKESSLSSYCVVS